MVRKGKLFLGIAVLGIALVGARGGLAQRIDAVKAAKVKSAYLLNFTRFTTWPDAAFADEDSPLVICVWGRNGIEASLEEIVEGKKIFGRVVVISHIEDPEANTAVSAEDDTPHENERLPEGVMARLKGCHLLYLGKTKTIRTRDILKAVEPLNILTVSDIPRFAEQGGMLGLVLRKGKIAFDANADAIKRSGVVVSSKILKLAKIVDTDRD